VPERPPPDFRVPRLGAARIPSPLQVPDPSTFVGDDARLFADPRLGPARAAFAAGVEPPSFELAGPRAALYFEPHRVRAAIATCGGISPGLNDVVRALVLGLAQRYGVADIFGARYGYRGLAAPGDLVPLAPADVALIHQRGGTVLGTCRGTPAVAEIVDTLVAHGIDLFFPVGGDGTLRGALEIAEEIARRRLAIAVVGLPKTIDNDIPWVRRSFGFQTAVRLAAEAVRGAHVEATSVAGGVGMVKVMGRHSGYLAANTTLASGLVDFCLVPECAFGLDGEQGLLALVERKLAASGAAVIVVAEGAGQELFAGQELGYDASGNRKLGDIGLVLRRELERHFAGRGRPFAMKYLDPSYLVRSAPADTSDALHAARLAQNAVHAALSGRTAILIGYWHGQMTHVPLAALRGESRAVNPRGELWWNVLETTGQPPRIGDDPA
jgi:6-phosphofructokinase 1